MATINTVISSPLSIDHFHDGDNEFKNTGRDIYSLWTSSGDANEAALSIQSSSPPSGESSYVRAHAQAQMGGGYFVEALLCPRVYSTYGELRPNVNNVWALEAGEGDAYTWRVKFRANAALVGSTTWDYHVFADGLTAADGSGHDRQIESVFNSSTGGEWLQLSFTYTISSGTNNAFVWPLMQAEAFDTVEDAVIDIGAVELLIERNQTLYHSHAGFRFPYPRWT
jgi:hypothetical protein